MVNPRPALLQIAGDAGTLRGRPDQFDLATVQGQKSHGRFLIGHIFGQGER